MAKVDAKLTCLCVYVDNSGNVNCTIPCALLLLYDGRMHMQTVCQQVQMRQCTSRHCLEDVIAAVTELDAKTLGAHNKTVP